VLRIPGLPESSYALKKPLADSEAGSYIAASLGDGPAAGATETKVAELHGNKGIKPLASADGSK
jgi:hypothetical protein